MTTPIDKVNRIRLKDRSFCLRILSKKLMCLELLKEPQLPLIITRNLRLYPIDVLWNERVSVPQLRFHQESGRPRPAPAGKALPPTARKTSARPPQVPANRSKQYGRAWCAAAPKPAR